MLQTTSSDTLTVILSYNQTCASSSETLQIFPSQLNDQSYKVGSGLRFMSFDTFTLNNSTACLDSEITYAMNVKSTGKESIDFISIKNQQILWFSDSNLDIGDYEIFVTGSLNGYTAFTSFILSIVGDVNLSSPYLSHWSQ